MSIWIGSDGLSQIPISSINLCQQVGTPPPPPPGPAHPTICTWLLIFCRYACRMSPEVRSRTHYVLLILFLYSSYLLFRCFVFAHMSRVIFLVMLRNGPRKRGRNLHQRKTGKITMSSMMNGKEILILQSWPGAVRKYRVEDDERLVPRSA